MKRKMEEACMTLQTYKVKDIETLKLLGRTARKKQPLTLFWTGSGIECRVQAAELWIEVEADYSAYEPWISIVINGAYVSRRMIEKGRQWICIFRGMNPEVIKSVKIIKEVQAMSGDEEHLLQVQQLRTDGSFLPVEEKPYKLEFIGDSITSGEGSIGAKVEEDWISMWFSTENNYARMTADALNAEYRLLCQSGWGVYSSWDNNPHAAMPLYYEKVCGLLTGERNEALGAKEENDFKAWQPNVIIINLGTNDGGAFNSPAWKDEATGESFKQRLNEDGSFNKEDIKCFEEAAVAFLHKLRKYNEESYIVWAYGMLGNAMAPFIKEAIAAYQKDSGDKKVSFIALPDTTEQTVGARQHPGALSHKQASDVLVEYLQILLS